MAQDTGPSSPGRGEAVFRPWPLLISGLGLTLLGVLLTAVPAPGLRAFCLAAGLLTCAVAVGRHLRQAGWELPERLESAGLLALVGVAGALAYFGMDREVRREGQVFPDYGWDSGRLFCGALVLACLGGSLLLLLPWAWRKAALSLLVLFHFFGIVVTVTSVDPGPWLSKQLYMRVYRPYLSFLYMTNAYHFYSPEPGAPPLLWFAVHYDDNTWKWYKVPDREGSPVGMHYQRMLAMPQHVFASTGRSPASAVELAGPLAAYRRDYEKRLRERNEMRMRPFLESREEVLGRRRVGSTLPYQPWRIPLIPFDELAESVQYLEPQDGAQLTISSCAKYVFHNPPPPDNPGARVRSVKAYRVIHTVISPAELAQGGSATHENKYMPYFLGEFDGAGSLLDRSGRPFSPDREFELDPFLYWYLPRVVVPKDYAQAPRGPVVLHVPTPAPKDGIVLDALEIHAAATPQGLALSPKGDK